MADQNIKPFARPASAHSLLRQYRAAAAAASQQAQPESSQVPEEHPDSQSSGFWAKVTAYLRTKGVETTGIKPTRPDDRHETRLYQFFLFWFSTTMNIISFSGGSLGPSVFSLGLMPTFYTCLCVDLIFYAVPAYLAVFGPKLGMRAMVHARYSWGYYGAKIPSILNALSLLGFLILDCILGGQSISSISDHVGPSLGIVIIAAVSLFLSFSGIRALGIYQNVAWILCVIVFIAMVAAPGNVSHLATALDYSPPLVAANLISFGSYTASSALSWCTMAPDFGVHFSESSSSYQIFGYTYLALVTSSLLGQTLGAAFAAASFSIPTWAEGYRNGSDLGGLFGAILSPLGGFGKFLAFVLGLTMCSPAAATMYSFSTTLMAVFSALGKMPRYLFALISTAILLPVAIVGATHFYSVLVNILGFVGYWVGIHVGVVFVEHVIFRLNSFLEYDLKEWCEPTRLSKGYPAMLSFLLAVGIIIPSISKEWFTGPIGKLGTGDIGVLTGMAMATICYFFARWFELWRVKVRNDFMMEKGNDA